MSRDELLKGLTPEQIEKARACKSKEELLALAEEEEVELTKEQLKAVNGGLCQVEPKTGFTCPNCLGTNTLGYHDEFMNNSRGGYKCECKDCGCRFETK